jgi:hypothetical protein
MATTTQYIPGSATPYSLKLRSTGDAGGAATFTLAALLSAAHEGPLKAALARTLPTECDEFNLDQIRGEEIRIYTVAADTVAPRSGLQEFVWVAGANAGIAGLSCRLTNTEVRILEIRLNHSTQA